jgi:hypothetical protein
MGTPGGEPIMGAQCIPAAAWPDRSEGLTAAAPGTIAAARGSRS